MKPFSQAFALVGYAIFLCLNLPVLAQTGVWIEQPLDQSMTGTVLLSCGKTVAAFTRQQSRTLYFFDTNSSRWTTISLGRVRNILHLEATGNVAIAYTDSILIGYSGLVSEYDTVCFEGDLLPAGPESYPRGCGPNLAWFVTRSFAYVFDGSLGKWKKHRVQIPDGYLGGDGHFLSRDNYVAIIIYNSQTNYLYNLAYSMECHAFSELQKGGYYPDEDWEMNYGFWAHYQDEYGYHLIGYSAFTNRFEEIILRKNPFPTKPQMLLTNMRERTVYVTCITEMISPPDNFRLICFGFDTRLGCWKEFIWDYNSSIWAFSGFYCGGQVAMMPLQNKKTSLYDYIVFSGTDTSFTQHSPKIRKDVVDFGTMLGGTVVCDFDSSLIWFYSDRTKQTSYFAFTGENIYSPISGESYSCFRNYPIDDPDKMNIYVFNENAGNILSFTTPYGWGNQASNENMAGFGTKNPLNRVYFYSSILHDYNKLILPDGIEYPKIIADGVICHVNHLSYYGLYDAVTNQVYAEECNTLKLARGKNILVLYKNYQIFSVYSSHTHAFHELRPPEGFYDVFAGTDIGLFVCYNPRIVFACNGLAGNYVQLDPLPGEPFNVKIGGNTALVQQNSVIYAFTPNAESNTQIPSSQIQDENSLHLTAYPNPFHSHITFSYKITNPGHSIITIYDIAGRKQKTLTDGYFAPGWYSVNWDGKDDKGRRLKNGMYLVNFQNNTNQVRTKIFFIK